MTEQAIRDANGLDVPFGDFVADGVVSIIVVQRHRPRFANQAAARLFGYDSPDEIAAMESAEALYAPYERARIRNYGERRRNREPAPDRYEVVCCRRDGSNFWSENHVYWTEWAGEPAAAIVLIDITSRKRAELAYTQSERRFRDFAELGSDWLWELDADLRYSYVSPRYTEITGRPAGYLLGHTRRELSKLWPHDNQAEWDQFLATLDAHRDFNDFVYMIPHEDGRPLTLSNSGRALFSEDGRFLGYRGIGHDLTAQVAAEARRDEAVEEARRARQQLAESIEGISDAFILYDADDRLVLCNERYREMYPYLPPKERLVGLTFEDLIRLGMENRVVDDPEVRADPEAWLRKRLEAHRNPTGTSTVQKWNDGRAILIREWRTRDGGIVGIRSDITAMQRAEQRLLDAIESIDEGFVLWDSRERLVLCNERYRDINRHVADLLEPGVQFEDVISAAVSKHPPVPVDQLDDYIADYLEAFRAGTDRRFEWQVADGRWILGKERRTGDGGFVGVRTDITAVKERESQLSEARERAERTADLLAERSRDLERSNRDLEDFAHVASHDLKEPLRKIIAFGERLMTKYGTSLDEDGRYYVERMAAASRRMQDLVTGLLNYARIGRAAAEFSPTSLRDTAARVVEDLEVRVQEMNGSIDIDGDCAIDAEPGLLHRLLLNLLGNALKFHREGVPPVVRISIHPYSGDKGLDFCRITVADNGIGFEETATDKIFRPFQRLHGRDAYEGTGIGLAIVQRIVDHHGGIIRTESTPGTGTTFTIELPVKQRRRQISASNKEQEKGVR